jgi:hypothetical protein
VTDLTILLRRRVGGLMFNIDIVAPFSNNPDDNHFLRIAMVSICWSRRSWIIHFLLLLDAATSTRELHRKMFDRGVSSSLPSKTMSNTEKSLLVSNSHQMLLMALGAALTVATPAVSKAKEETEYIESLLQNTDTDICVFSPGFKIELEQYKNIIYKDYPYTRSSAFATADDGDSSNVSLKRDAEGVLSEVKRLANLGHKSKERENRRYPLLLMGHSRGGSVATLAATTFLDAIVKNTKVGAASSVTDSIRSSPAKALLVLLDPVDSSEGATLLALNSSLQGIKLRESFRADKRLQKSDYSGTNPLSVSDHNRGDECTAWPWPVLIISTPYGGSSGYYKVPYESACAPVSRNGDAFAGAFISCPTAQVPLPVDSSTSTLTIQSLLSPPITNGKIGADNTNSVSNQKIPEKIFSRILHVKLPDVGHTQLLQNRKKSTFGSVCAANDKIPDSKVEDFVIFLTKEWVNMCISSNDFDENQYQAEIKEMRSNASRVFPSLKTEWIS